MKKGFTLIEMAIVLVIIGLIVGSVLVGRDLVSAAMVRATITQIEKYNQATNTFRGKYGSLPGDIKDPAASNFGFVARGAATGQGDGNSLIEGAYPSGTTTHNALFQDEGETLTFWMDLSKAGLIEGNFTSGSPTSQTATNITGAQLSQYLPEAKLGNGNYIYAGELELWNGGTSWLDGTTNYFNLSVVTRLQTGTGLGIDNDSSPGLTVAQARAIDTKMDDGLPQSGAVLASYASWWASPGAIHVSTTNASQGYTTATSPASNTCYDNQNFGGAIQKYSMSFNGGAGVNCGLIFKFQ